jgi:hypothetical protein
MNLNARNLLHKHYFQQENIMSTKNLAAEPTVVVPETYQTLAFFFRTSKAKKVDEASTSDDGNRALDELNESGAIYRAYVDPDYYEDLKAGFAAETPKPGRTKLSAFMTFPLPDRRALFVNRRHLVVVRCLCDSVRNLLDPGEFQSVSEDASPSHSVFRVCFLDQDGGTNILQPPCCEPGDEEYEYALEQAEDIVTLLASDGNGAEEFVEQSMIYFFDEDFEGVLLPVRQIVWVEVNLGAISDDIACLGLDDETDSPDGLEDKQSGSG